MPNNDSLEEFYGRVLEEEFGKHAQAVGVYLERRYKGGLQEGASPKEVIKQELFLVFRQGVNEYIRQGAWHFLEGERKRQGLTQAQLAEKAAASQSTYSKIRTGEASFESILLFLRAMNVQAGALPIPPASEQTIEGLTKVFDFVERQVFGADIRRRPVSREDLEWLLHLDACIPWTVAYATGDESTGQVIADCVAASISIRLGRAVPARRFGELVKLWQTRLAPWEVCMATIARVLRVV